MVFIVSANYLIDVCHVCTVESNRVDKMMAAEMDYINFRICKGCFSVMFEGDFDKLYDEWLEDYPQKPLVPKKLWWKFEQKRIKECMDILTKQMVVVGKNE